MPKLPRDILECAERVMDYHRLSKLDEKTKRLEPDAQTRAFPHRVFDYAPEKIELSKTLMDAPTPVLSLLEHGLESVPESAHTPPQNLQTLSSWLYLAAGLRQKRVYPWGIEYQRPYPSADAAFPVEIYVAAFAIEGLSPGLYHFSPREYALRKLREGPETLSMMRRGRPDLHFLSTVPGALLLSAVFCRSGWVQGRRGYRQAVIDTGHVVENCHATAMALGMNTVTRLRMNDSCMRELIGLPEDFDYISAEAVQATVIWADEARQPMDTLQRPPVHALELLPRPHMGECVSYGSVLAVHHDTLARGVVGRDVRPPLTDLSPLPATVTLNHLPATQDAMASKPLRELLLNPPASVDAFDKRPISRAALAEISRAAFRGGTYFPMKPSGGHVALVRPFWVIHNVSGQEAGIWWHDPMSDQWGLLNRGQYAEQMPRLLRDSPERAAVVCVMVANLRVLLGEAGPDLYRLALLEAGIVAQRLNLGAASLGIACTIHGAFYDELWRQFLGLSATGWEPLLVTTVGNRPERPAAATVAAAP